MSFIMPADAQAWQAFVDMDIARLKASSPIPSLNMFDVADGASIYDAADPVLHDPALHARVAHWLAKGSYTQKDLKAVCSENKLRIGQGIKKVLALKLALIGLPAETAAAAESAGGKKVVGEKPVEKKQAKKRKAVGDDEQDGKVAKKTGNNGSKKE